MVTGPDASPFADVGREDADLVAVGVAQIGAVHVTRRCRAETRAALVGAARGEPSGVPGIDFVVALGLEAQRVTVGDAHRLAIGGPGDDQRALGARISGAVRQRMPLVTEHAHRRVVELATGLDIVGAEEYVIEPASLSCGQVSRPTRAILQIPESFALVKFLAGVAPRRRGQ